MSESSSRLFITKVQLQVASCELRVAVDFLGVLMLQNFVGLFLLPPADSGGEGKGMKCERIRLFVDNEFR